MRPPASLEPLIARIPELRFHCSDDICFRRDVTRAMYLAKDFYSATVYELPNHSNLQNQANWGGLADHPRTGTSTYSFCWPEKVFFMFERNRGGALWAVEMGHILMSFTCGNSSRSPTSARNLTRARPLDSRQKTCGEGGKGGQTHRYKETLCFVSPSSHRFSFFITAAPFAISPWQVAVLPVLYVLCCHLSSRWPAVHHPSSHAYTHN